MAPLFLQAAEAYGLPANEDFNGASQEGVGWYQVTHRNGARASTAVCYLHPVMERANLKKLAEPDFTVSLRAVPPSVVVVDEGQIPRDYWKPQPPRLDRQGLSAALKSGRAAICGRAAAGGCGFRSRPRIRANVACNSARGTTWSTMPWSSKYSAR